MMTPEALAGVDWVYEQGMDESSTTLYSDYYNRHGIEAIQILTVYSDSEAREICSFLEPRIRGKVVAEVGAGIGLLGMHMAAMAKQVWAIEICPDWAWVYTNYLHERRPKNFVYVCSEASEVAGMLRADVAVFCTYSAPKQMADAAALLAPEVVDIRAEFESTKQAEMRALNGKLWGENRLKRK